MNFRDYGTITVFINADEEIGSPGSRNSITRLGAEHDAVDVVRRRRQSEGGPVRLATSGIAPSMLDGARPSSHAGGAPERGVNALYELAHQILQMRDLSDPETGLKVNWTLAQGRHREQHDPAGRAGERRRARRSASPTTTASSRSCASASRRSCCPRRRSSSNFERRLPPLEANRRFASAGAHAQTIYREIGKKLRRWTIAARRRHRRGQRGAQDEGAGDRRLRAARVRLAHHQRRIHPDRAPSSRASICRAHDHGHLTGQDSAGAVSRISVSLVLIKQVMTAKRN